MDFRRPLRVALLPLLLLSASCATVPRVAPEGELTILHTNDIHAAFNAKAVTWSSAANGGSDTIGGFVALESYVRRERASAGHSLLLDAGDLMTGNPICDMEVGGAEGGALVGFMNRVGYDGFTPGNHDFDKGYDNFMALMGRFRCPVICANLLSADGVPIVPEAYHIYRVGPFRVGVIGLMMDDLARDLGGETAAKVRVAPLVETAKEMAAKLDPETDVLILVTHQGVDEDRALAEAVGPVVDLIVGGHSHTPLGQPKLVNGVLIVQAGCGLENLGRIDLKIRDDRVVAYEGHLIALYTEGIDPDPALAAEVAAYQAKIDAEYGEVLATLEAPWTRNYYGESSVGDFTADALRAWGKTDVAFMNSGGIRKNVAAGELTRLDMYELFPFLNEIVTFEVTGAELLTIIRTNARSALVRDHGILQVSGLTYQWRPRGEEVEILDARVGGEPIDPARTYTGTTGHFIVADQSQKYFGLPSPKHRRTGVQVRGVLEEAVRAKKSIRPATDGRIRRVE
jgi:5'-nucleotidase/UDP-sugar diphosphatase